MDIVFGPCAISCLPISLEISLAGENKRCPSVVASDISFRHILRIVDMIARKGGGP